MYLSDGAARPLKWLQYKAASGTATDMDRRVAYYQAQDLFIH